MSMRNVLSTLLATLLVCNASCACASMPVAEQSVADTHAHHLQAGDVLPVADCPHSGCDACDTAVGVLSGKDGAQSGTYKFEIDDLHWLAINPAPIDLLDVIGTSGLPATWIPYAASTPPRRFDLQLE